MVDGDAVRERNTDLAGLGGSGVLGYGVPLPDLKTCDVVFVLLGMTLLGLAS